MSKEAHIVEIVLQLDETALRRIASAIRKKRSVEDALVLTGHSQWLVDSIEDALLRQIGFGECMGCSEWRYFKTIDPEYCQPCYDELHGEGGEVNDE